MTGFRLLFAFDALVTLAAAFPLATLFTGSSAPLSAAGVLLPILAICIAALWGAATLQAKGRIGLANLVLLIPAVPAVLGLIALGLIILLFSMGGPHH